MKIRNPEILSAGYFDVLRRHRVAHVYSAWARMPDLLDQIAMPGSLTADFIVSRALLRRGRAYEEAVRLFEPYTEIREPYAPAREGLKQLIATARSRKMSAYIYVNNRLEGNAPETIKTITGG